MPVWRIAATAQVIVSRSGTYVPSLPDCVLCMQAASSPGLAPQRCNLLLPKHKPVRQQAAQQAPHRAPHKGVSHPSHTRKAQLPAPPGATLPAQITHSFLEPSPSSQKVASNAASQAQLLPQSFPDLAWQSPPVGKAPASWVQGSASAMLSCSPEGCEQAQQQGQGGGLFRDSSNSSSSSSDEGLTPEAARASAERSVSSLASCLYVLQVKVAKP